MRYVLTLLTKSFSYFINDLFLYNYVALGCLARTGVWVESLLNQLEADSSCSLPF